MPATAVVPIHVRWVFNLNDGEGTSQVDFMIDEPVAVPQATTQPSTSQPTTTAPTTTTQPVK